jgi:WD40 repeat protein
MQASPVYCFSPDDKMIAIASGKCLSVIDTRTGKGIAMCDINLEITSLNFYQDYVMVGCVDGSISIYDIHCKKLVASRQVCSGSSIRSLAVTSDGNYIVAGTSMGEVVMVTVKALKTIKVFDCGVGTIYLVTCQQGNIVVAGSKCIRTWQTSPLKCIRTVEWHGCHGSFGHGGSVMGYHDDAAYLWTYGNEHCRHYKLRKNVSCATYCSGGKYLAYSVDKTVYIVK